MTLTNMGDQGSGPDRRLILHVGLPKTATTAIQRAMRRMAAPLASAGYLYPKAGRPRVTTRLSGHHNLAYELNDPAKFASSSGGWAEVRDEFDSSGLSSLIISSEGIRASLAPIIAAKIDKLFPHHTTTVVLYLRPQWDYIESGYNQLARFGRLDADIAEFWSTTGVRITDYRSIVESWMKHFGSDGVRCFPFDKEMKFIGAETHFVQRALGLDLAFPRNSEVANPKAGMRAISAVHFCRDNYRRHFGDPSAELPSAHVVEILQRVRAAGDDTSFSFLGPDLAEVIFQHSASTNRWLAETFPEFNSPAFLRRPEVGPAQTVKGLPPPNEDEVVFCLELAAMRHANPANQDSNAERNKRRRRRSRKA